MTDLKRINKSGLYRPEFEKGSCGFGLIAQMDNQSSHWLVQTAIKSLCRLTHRGAVAADGKTGDGCGLLMKKPDAFLQACAKELGYKFAPLYAVGMVFLNQDDDSANKSRRRLEAELKQEGLSPLGWREVPTSESACARCASSAR